MNEAMENDLEKQLRDFAQGFDYPATPPLAKTLPRPAKIRWQQRRASQIRGLAYGIGAVLVLVVTFYLLRASLQSDEAAPLPEVSTSEEIPSSKGFRTLPPYPAHLGYPDYVLYQYENTSYSVILAWKKAGRGGIAPFQQVSGFGSDIQSYLIRQSINQSSRPVFKVSNSPLHEEQLADGSTLIWQVTRYPFTR
jgi:hypothetical protein